MTLRRASLMAVAAGIVLLVAGLWLARMRLAAEFARAYFRQHGIAASVAFDTLGLSGVSGRFALGPAETPYVSAERIELVFSPLRWKPYLTGVRLERPVVRARLDDAGRLTLPGLQAWLDSLGQGGGSSGYVSPDLAVELAGLRILLATPGGTADIGGDVRLVKMRPVAAALRIRPGTFSYRGTRLRLSDGTLALAARGNAYHVTAHAAGDMAHAPLAAADAAATLEADLRFANGGVLLSDAKARLTARRMDGPLKASGIVLAARAARLAVSGAGVDGEGDVTLAALVTPPPDAMKAAQPLLAMDARLRRAIAANLGPAALRADAHAAIHAGAVALRLNRPLTLRGAGGGLFTLAALDMRQADGRTEAALDAALAGGGLPTLAVKGAHVGGGPAGWRMDGGLTARFDFAALRGADVALDGVAAWSDGVLTATLARCGRVRLQALETLVHALHAALCPAAAPLFVSDAAGWRAAAQMRDAAASLPPADAALAGGVARLAFRGGRNGVTGDVAVTAATLSDAAAARRFNPLSGTGRAALAGNVWQGRFDAAAGGHALGSVRFRHDMGHGRGSADVSAALRFTEDGLQPDMLSPLLAALRRAAGKADFAGTLAWDRDGVTSRGTLAVKDLDFLTPLGRAHAVDGDWTLTSLLPPVTAPGQELKIARIDWTLPLAGLDVRFALAPGTLHVAALDTGIAEGRVALAPFSVSLAVPGTLASDAAVRGLSLAPLIAASNLGGKATLEGKLSGDVPFSLGPEGLRIRNGHLAADGPGRLSIKRSLWGESALTANAVQDFAYQALESLAYDSLSADLNSIDGGRLQIVFRIKGRSDPPQAQTADVPLRDILDGSVLSRSVPLPSGTPINLTLDTSLNFDELLRSYAEAWSKSLNPGASP